jgi:general secretion pathway protein L
MNVKAILNADMTTVTLWLRQAFRWWWEEISALLPAEWRERLAARASIVAEFSSGALELRRLKDGQPIDHDGKRKSVVLALPPSAVLTREVDFPLLTVSDLRRIAALEIDRYTPFAPARVHFDTEILARDPEKGRQRVLLGVIPRDEAAGFMSRASDLALEPTAVGVANEAGGSNIHFDFLPAMREADGAMSSGRRLLYIWAAAALLLVLNMSLLIARDITSLDALRAEVEAQQAPLNVAIHLREKVESEGETRAALMARKAHDEPLRVLDAVTRAMPLGDWVQHFEWNGKSVRLVGYGKGKANVLAQLEASRILGNARAATADRSASGPAGVPFDIVADAKGAP